MLHDPSRHEALQPIPWDDSRVRATIQRIARAAEADYDEASGWPLHPQDDEGDQPSGQGATPFYHGAAGVAWALHYLQDAGAATLDRDYRPQLEAIRERNREWLAEAYPRERASLLNGDTPILLMQYGTSRSEELARSLGRLIDGNLGHPARELMWGAPGTMLAALFLHELTGDDAWADRFRTTAARLWSELETLPGRGCRSWTQALHGHRVHYLGAVHGFAGVALGLVRGHRLFDHSQWRKWAECIVETVELTALRDEGGVNWPPDALHPGGKRLMQICHGAPGMVVCLAGFPGKDLDELLVDAGEAIWRAGPLAKGSNLCHGTGGNGYAFLALYQRTGEARWLDRARSFAMHGIAQTEAAGLRCGQFRHSLWTGDPGFAIYLWDCVRAMAQFPMLDVFFATMAKSAPAHVRPSRERAADG